MEKTPATSAASGKVGRPAVVPGHDPMAGLAAAHLELLTLCDTLEGIADSLPGTLDVRLCQEAAETLVPVVTRVHRTEENVIFPAVIGNRADSMSSETVEHLRAEHCEDECFAEELADALSQAGRRDARIQPETLGYMLRGFFEAMRRHINFERERLSILASRL